MSFSQRLNSCYRDLFTPTALEKLRLIAQAVELGITRKVLIAMARRENCEDKTVTGRPYFNSLCAAPVSAFKNPTKKILFVDENSQHTAEVLKAFDAAGARENVVVVQSESEVLDYLNYRQKYLLRSDGAPVLILLALDARKPEGLDVLRAIRPQLSPRNIPTLILVSAYEENLARDSYELGANSFIVKPAHFLDFVKVIKNLAAFWTNLNERAP